MHFLYSEKHPTNSMSIPSSISPVITQSSSFQTDHIYPFYCCSFSLCRLLHHIIIHLSSWAKFITVDTASGRGCSAAWGDLCWGLCHVKARLAFAFCVFSCWLLVAPVREKESLSKPPTNYTPINHRSLCRYNRGDRNQRGQNGIVNSHGRKGALWL